MHTTRERAESRTWDLIVIGGGPAGSQAALSAATEGRSVLLLEGGQIGGQIAHTPHLENFAGHTYGITGPAIARAFEEQAGRFGVRLLRDYATGLGRRDGLLHVRTRTGVEARCLAVVIATGQSFRRLGIPGEDAEVVHHGPGEANTLDAADREVVVVGGGNSAGQAIVRLAQQRARQVHVLVRRALATSAYLTERILLAPNVLVHQGATLREVQHLGPDECAALVHVGGELRSLTACRVYVCAGMAPATGWLPASVERDERGFIRTGPDFQTTLPGVFAVGDTRAGAVSRVPSAIGEAASLQPALWNYLESAGS